MKKRIVAFVSCVLVLVSLIAVSVSAQTTQEYWTWLYERRNPLTVANVHDPSYDVDKTPDIYVELDSAMPKFPKETFFIFIQNMIGYIELDYYNYVTDSYGTVVSPVSTFGLYSGNPYVEVIPSYEWILFVNYYDSEVNYRMEYDRENQYWTTTYYPHLRISDMRFFLYLNHPDYDAIPTDFVCADWLFRECGIKPLYPYVSGAYKFADSYNQGVIDGYGNGFAEGVDFGLDEGYQDGYSDGLVNADGTSWMNLKNLIFTIFDAPFYVLSTAFSFEVFGINIAGTLIGLITLGAVVWILKKIYAR